MATNKPFSFAAFCTYGNACFNDPEKTPDIRDAFKTDLKKAIAHAGYPTKEEINIVDDINDFDMSATLQQVPKIVSGFMHDEQRNFDIPSSDSKTCAATVKVVAVDEKTKELTQKSTEEIPEAGGKMEIEQIVSVEWIASK